MGNLHSGEPVASTQTNWSLEVYMTFAQSGLTAVFPTVSAGVNVDKGFSTTPNGVASEIEYTEMAPSLSLVARL
jgi:hypothetical protein